MHPVSPAPDNQNVRGSCHDGSAPTSAPEAQKAFEALLRSVEGEGSLSVKTKELLLFSLVVFSRCGPCFESHYQKALRLGITQQELDEAAWCAVVMGGAPVKMFYRECLATCVPAKDSGQST